MYRSYEEVVQALQTLVPQRPGEDTNDYAGYIHRLASGIIEHGQKELPNVVARREADRAARARPGFDERMIEDD